MGYDGRNKKPGETYVDLLVSGWGDQFQALWVTKPPPPPPLQPSEASFDDEGEAVGVTHDGYLHVLFIHDEKSGTMFKVISEQSHPYNAASVPAPALRLATQGRSAEWREMQEHTKRYKVRRIK
jgi:hypothetical protein